MLKSGILQCCLIAIMMLSCFSSALADDDSQTLLFHVEGRSANELAKAAVKALSREDVVITADAETNLLIIKGPEAAVAKTTQLLKSLDRVPSMVTIDVEIAINDPENDGVRKVLDRLQLSTLEENQAMVQLGQVVTVVTGSQSFGSRGTQVTTQKQNTGTILRATPRVSSRGITMELYIEKSWLEYPVVNPDAEKDDKAPAITPPTTYTVVVETTLHVDRGKNQTIKAAVSGGTSVREALIEVSASAAATSEKRASVRAGSGSTSGRSDPQRIESRPSASRSSGASRSGDETRGRFGGRGAGSSSSGGRGGASTSSGGRGGFGSRREGSSQSTAEQSAKRMFDQFDQNGDGEISGNERERIKRLVDVLGFETSDEVTLKSLTEKIKIRMTGRSGEDQKAEHAESNDT